MAWYDSCLLIVLWSISSQLQYLVSTTLMIPIHSGRNQHLKAAFNSSENKIIHFLLKKLGVGGEVGVFQGCSRISQSIYVLLRQIIAWMCMSVGFCLTYRCSSIEFKWLQKWNLGWFLYKKINSKPMQTNFSFQYNSSYRLPKIDWSPKSDHLLLTNMI